MYCEYWKLNKPPFDNVPDSSMYVDCHTSMEDVISETIFAIKEGNECFAVIFGEVGLGKTLSLRIIIDSLEPEKYKVALITNPALSFIQLLREIIGQITGKQCEEKKKVDLLEIFNRLLFETHDQGQKIVIVIDESNVLSSSNLDDLRLLTNMQDDENNLFTLILAGQMELAQKLEHPKRANLFQRIGTYGHIEKLPSEKAVQTYIETRLMLAGSQRKLFADDAIPVIWEFSENGIPRLINKICKLCLKAGETNEFNIISGEVAAQIADRFQKLSKTSMQKRKLLNRPENDQPDEDTDKPKAELPQKKTRSSVPRKTTPKIEIPAIEIPTPPKNIPAETATAKIIGEPVFDIPAPQVTTPLETAAVEIVEESVFDIPAPQATSPLKTAAAEKVEEPIFDIPAPQVTTPLETAAAEIVEEPVFDIPAPQVTTPLETAAAEKVEEPVFDIPTPQVTTPLETATNKTTEKIEKVVTDVLPQKKHISSSKKTVPLPKPSSNVVPIQKAAGNAERISPPSQRENTPVSLKENEAQTAQKEQDEVYEEVLIGQHKVKLSISPNVIRQAKSASSESKNKLAGYWSAQIIKENPHMMHSPLIDPVSIWFEIKNVILKKFDNNTSSASSMTSL